MSKNILKEIQANLLIYDKPSIYYSGGHVIGERKSSKTFEFSNVSINLNTKPYFKIESTNTENIREDYVSFYEVKKMLKFELAKAASLFSGEMMPVDSAGY